MKHIPLSLTSTFEDTMSVSGDHVGHSVSSSSSRGEVTIREDDVGEVADGLKFVCKV